MSSKYTNQLVAKATKLAFDLRLLHFHTKVVSESKNGNFRVEYIFESRVHFWQRLAAVGSFLLACYVAIAYGLWFDFTQPGLKTAGRFSFYVVVITDVMATTLLLILTLFGNEFSDLSVMYASMEYQLRKIHGVQGKDGIEKIMKALLALIVGCTVSVPFISFELVELNVHVFGQLKVPYGLGGIFYAVSSMVVVFINWLQIFICVQGAFVYVIGTLKWLNMLRWKPNMESGQKDKMIFAYRMHQTIHIFATQSTSTILALAYTASSVLMITLLVALIGFYDKLGIMFSFALVSTLITAVVATKLLTDLAVYLTECSADFADSFLKNDFTMNQAQRRAMKSSSALVFKIGSFSTISRETFPFLMTDVVVAQVADILVGMRETSFN